MIEHLTEKCRIKQATLFALILVLVVEEWFVLAAMSAVCTWVQESMVTAVL